MRPIFFGATFDGDRATYQVLFVNNEIDGDHRVGSVELNSVVKSQEEATQVAFREFSTLTSAELDELSKCAELIDRAEFEREYGNASRLK